MASPSIPGKEWSWEGADGAQTNKLVQAVGATERLEIVFGQFYASASNQGDVEIRLGFSTGGTLPAKTSNAGGATGIIYSHPGISKGGGAVLGRRISGPLGASLYIAFSSGIIGGALRLQMDCQLLTEQDTV